MCQPVTPVLPVSERKLRHVAVSWAAPGQATACQYLLSVVPTAQHKGTWRLNSNVRFSNRQVRVKRFQTIHCRGVDVARGLCVPKIRFCNIVDERHQFVGERGRIRFSPAPVSAIGLPDETYDTKVASLRRTL
jgi:hypothetical protein